MESSWSQIPSLEVKTLKSGKQELKSLEGILRLSSWQGFQSRRGPYNSIDKKETSDGTVKLIVGEYTSSDNLLSLSKEQVNAYHFIVEHQSTLMERMLQALLPVYQQLRQQYGYEDDDACMPTVSSHLQFKSLIGLSCVHILEQSKAGISYVGYEFGCTWDDEHGLGIMTHKDRVIEIGAVDTAFDTWIAEKDIDPVGAAEELEKHRTAPPGVLKKPWWKFW